MKSIFSTAFAALSYAPLAMAGTYFTRKAYSDSKCTYLTSVWTLNGPTDCSSFAEEECTNTESYNTSEYEKTYCGSSLTGAMPDSYVVVYNDTECSTGSYVRNPHIVLRSRVRWFK